MESSNSTNTNHSNTNYNAAKSSSVTARTSHTLFNKLPHADSSRAKLGFPPSHHHPHTLPQTSNIPGTDQAASGSGHIALLAVGAVSVIGFLLTLYNGATVRRLEDELGETQHRLEERIREADALIGQSGALYKAMDRQADRARELVRAEMHDFGKAITTHVDAMLTSQTREVVAAEQQFRNQLLKLESNLSTLQLDVRRFAPLPSHAHLAPTHYQTRPDSSFVSKSYAQPQFQSPALLPSQLQPQFPPQLQATSDAEQIVGQGTQPNEDDCDE